MEELCVLLYEMELERVLERESEGCTGKWRGWTMSNQRMG